MKHAAFVLMGLAMGAAQAAAQVAESPRFEPKRLAQDVKVLSSDKFEGRGPNTAGENRTVNSLVQQFKAAGLKPGGGQDDGPR